MRIARPVFTGMALAIAVMAFSMSNTVLAKTKKHREAFTARPEPEMQPSYVRRWYVRPSDIRSEADRQLQGRF
jgi:hypothetical protein